jgi:hypothetical protein
VPAELYANRMQWLITLCVIRGYVEASYVPMCLVVLPSAYALGNIFSTYLRMHGIRIKK